MKFRASWGKTIGRPGWGDIQGGQVLDLLVRVDGGTGSQGNPALKPLESTNIDLSLEWYYAEGSYASVGYFKKDIDNYVGVTQIVEQPFDLHTPIGGALYNEAVAAACADREHHLHPQLDLHEPSHRSGRGLRSLAPSPDRQAIPSPTSASRCRRTSARQTLDGFEFNIQHMFGASGFGVSANYTLVDSGLAYDNQLPQPAVRARRPERRGERGRVLRELRLGRACSRTTGATSSCRAASTAPARTRMYTEEYGQIDLNVSYQWGDNLTLQAEAINLTDEIQRIHGRTDNEALFVTQTGPRYMIGARYKFGQ